MLGRPAGLEVEMPLPDFESARRYALDRLARELSPVLCYHSLAHTRDEVLPAATRLAEACQLEPGDTLLVRTAALYHDLGYAVQHYDHEQVSARIAAEVLPGFGYSRSQVTNIISAIWATRLPQDPHTLLDQILADADLDILGREEYLQRNDELRAEIAAIGTPSSDAEWYGAQLAFLQGHRYWTGPARELRDAGKERNIAALAARIALCCGR
jgi:uncharacterized protein